jgi:hypothetical protein
MVLATPTAPWRYHTPRLASICKENGVAKAEQVFRFVSDIRVAVDGMPKGDTQTRLSKLPVVADDPSDRFPAIARFAGSYAPIEIVRLED